MSPCPVDTWASEGAPCTAPSGMRLSEWVPEDERMAFQPEAVFNPLSSLWWPLALLFTFEEQI